MVVNWRGHLALLLVMVVGAAGGWWSYQQWQQGQTLAAFVVEPPRPLSPFTLSDHHQQPFTNADLAGHWTLLLIGYTQCPDICPTTLAQLAGVYPQLKANIANLQVVMVSADPQRDTPQRLAAYVPYFHPDFIGVTGPHPQLLPFSRELGLVYAMVDGQREGEYLVDHSASLVVIGPDGALRARFAPQVQVGQPALYDSEALLHDLPLLVARGPH